MFQITWDKGNYREALTGCAAEVAYTSMFMEQSGRFLYVGVANGFDESPEFVVGPALNIPASKFWPLQPLQIDRKTSSTTDTTLSVTGSASDVDSERQVSDWCLTSWTGSEVKMAREDLPQAPRHGQRASEGGCRQERKGKPNKQWWKECRTPLTCPLTGFPINLLPYPPYKLRKDPAKPWQYVLVDGKFLALYLITTGTFMANGRHLTHQDITSLSQHMHRCKLRYFSPERALQLEEAVWSDQGSGRMNLEASAELSKLKAAARAELARLRQIQDQRMSTNCLKYGLSF